MIPTIGRIVHYKLNADDVRHIDEARKEAGKYRGNAVHEGLVYPAMVVGSFSPAEGSYCNLKVFLDGHDEHWATSRLQGNRVGEWLPPPRVA